ncbi:MAG: DUF5343 domain-containing protein [Bacillota bacterium]|nr:DUF5343 domain-containing protein [Bacillota bacterium]
MGDFPYTTVPGKISDLFAKIKQTGIPPKVNLQWLQSVGFKSSNDRSLLTVLRTVGFADSIGSPTDLWKQYRGQGGKQVLAKGIREGYAELFSTYPHAHACSKEDLQYFFSTRSSAGKQAIAKTISTFQELCKLADFSASSPEDEAVEKEQDTKSRDVGSNTREMKSLRDFAININIQLTLPETTDEKVYEALFSSMKKHLLTGEI